MINSCDQDCEADGTDSTLIRSMLSMSPLERLEVLQACVGSLGMLREPVPTDS